MLPTKDYVSVSHTVAPMIYSRSWKSDDLDDTGYWMHQLLAGGPTTETFIQWYIQSNAFQIRKDLRKREIRTDSEYIIGLSCPRNWNCGGESGIEESILPGRQLWLRYEIWDRNVQPREVQYAVIHKLCRDGIESYLWKQKFFLSFILKFPSLQILNEHTIRY